MNKRFIFPIWKAEKIEKELSEIENDGYRLESVSKFGNFHFKPCAPRKSDYVFTLFYGKGEISMISTEQFLKENGGNEIKYKNSFLNLTNKSVFRVTKDIDLTEIRNNRDIQLSGVLIRNALLSAFMFILFFAPIVLSFIFQGIKAPINGYNLFMLYILSFCCVIALFFLIYNVLGYAYLKRKFKIIK